MDGLGRLGRAGRLLIALAVGGAVFGIATAVQASIPDASGVIHGCYSPNGAKSTNGTQLSIIDSAYACAKGQQAIAWNQQGPTGLKGTTGATGPTGLTGAGFDFAHSTGNPGPSISTSGTYLVETEVAINNGPSALVGACAVDASNIWPDFQFFDGAVNLPAGVGANYSLSGMLVLSHASTDFPYGLSVNCSDNSNQPFTPAGVRWWISKVS